jgi:large subunit ribosomal protein L25
MASAQTQATSPSTQTKAAKAAQALFNAQGIAHLEATERTGRGKELARRLRNEGHVPAIAYGRELASTMLSVSPKDVLDILQSERGANAVIEMDVKGAGKQLFMIREYTYHPVTRALEHVDFVQVKLDRPVNVDIPLIPTGKPVGVQEGGVLRQVYRTIPVRCLPDRIPLRVEIDVSHLALGEHVATQDLKLVEGVTVHLPPEQTLIAVVAPEKEVEEVVAEAIPGAVAAPGAAVPGAPAAGAAPAAAEGDAKGAPAAKGAPTAKAGAPGKEDKKKK